MNVEDLKGTIHRMIQSMAEAEIVRDFRFPLETRIDDDRAISWTTSSSLSANFGKFASLDEYCAYVKTREYHVMLFDAALLQFTYIMDGDDLVKHRLCYYPCPLDLSGAYLDDGGVLDWIEMMSADELRSHFRMRTPIRFDYDPKAAAKAANHPPSHFTISEEHCRIAVSAPISPGHFVRFVFANFYPDLWMSKPSLSGIPCHQWGDSLGNPDVDHLYLHWRKFAAA